MYVYTQMLTSSDLPQPVRTRPNVHTLPLPCSIKEEAAVSSEAARVLMPHVFTAMASLERVFPNDQASEVRRGY